jgi:hypothetical protein
MSLLDKLDNPFIARLAQQEAMSTMEITCDKILSNPDPCLCIQALVSVIDPAKLALPMAKQDQGQDGEDKCGNGQNGQPLPPDGRVWNSSAGYSSVSKV